MVERLTRLDEETLDYQVTVDDPDIWTRPWTVSFAMTRNADYMWAEYACHEGNYPLRHILSAARAGRDRALS